jgi:hypothetical protein
VEPQHYLKLMRDYLIPLQFGLFRLVPSEGECKRILDDERLGARIPGLSCWSHFHATCVERAREDSYFHAYKPRTYVCLRRSCFHLSPPPVASSASNSTSHMFPHCQS